MSVVKSPQQIQGRLLKSVANRKLFTTEENQPPPEIIRHICVMPCYDKKLEAVRPAGQIQNEDISINSTTNEVDAVLATHELADLFTKHNIDIKGLLDNLESPNPDTFDKDLTDATREIDSPYYSNDNQSQSSNGYTQYIFNRAARELLSVTPPENLDYQQVRNKDFHEVTLTVHGLPVMKFALAYGFRNIQNIIRNIKRKKCQYDYIEIMACPGGCLNGGGQIKPKDLNMSPADLLESLNEIQKNSLEIIDPTNLNSLGALYDGIETDKVKEMIKTYFTVIKTEASVANLKW